MPHENAFRHQEYSDVPADLWKVVVPADTQLDDEQRAALLSECGRRLSDAGVRVIYLVHGTLMLSLIHI